MLLLEGLYIYILVQAWKLACVCVCVHVYTETTWGGQRIAHRSWISFHHESPRAITQSLGLAAKHHLPADHFTSPCESFWLVPFGYKQLHICNMCFVLCLTYFCSYFFSENCINSQIRVVFNPSHIRFLASLFVKQCLCDLLSMQKWSQWILPRRLAY